MRKAYRLALSVLACTFTLAGCSAASQAEIGHAPGRSAAQIQVTNNNWSDVVVHLVRNSLRVRLGLVNSMNTTTFEVPETMVGPAANVYLVARPIGSRETFTSPTLLVGVGQQVDLRLENHLAVSSVQVR